MPTEASRALRFRKPFSAAGAEVHMKVSRPSRDFWGHARCGSTTAQGARGESWGHVTAAARVAVEAAVEVRGHIFLGLGSLGGVRSAGGPSYQIQLSSSKDRATTTHELHPCLAGNTNRGIFHSAMLLATSPMKAAGERSMQTPVLWNRPQYPTSKPLKTRNSSQLANRRSRHNVQ